MMKDIEIPEVKNVTLAVARQRTEGQEEWRVYLINNNEVPIENTLVASQGYGEKDGEQVKTSTLRHMFPIIEGGAFKIIEPIDEETFGLSNEYWLSYCIGTQIYEKKFIFLPESIVESNFIKLPVVNKPGVMIK